MAKQTFTTGQVLTAAQQNSLQSNDFNQTVSVKTANYSLLAADKGTRIEFNTSGSVTCTVNSGQFDAGDTLIIQNRGAGTATITAGTATVNTSATLVVKQYDSGVLYFVSDSSAIYFASDAADTPLTTKGDLFTFSTAADRLAVGSDGDTLVADSAATVGLRYSANFAAGKNKIINGDFFINQRAFTSNTTTDLYNFDRWQTVNSDGTVTCTPQTFTPGTAPVAGYESKNFLRIETTGQTLVSARANIAQKIESVRTFAGQTVTVSFWAKANSGTPSVSIEAFQNFGTGGSPSASVSGSVAAGTTSKKTISTTWARYSATLTIPSISGKTLGTTNDGFLSINLWVSGGSDFNTRTDSIGIQTNTFDFWGVQVEAGSVATAFQTATGTLQGELAACQRYYFRSNSGAAFSTFAMAMCGSTTLGFAVIDLPTTMRITPTSIDVPSIITRLKLTDIGSNNFTISAIAIDPSTPDAITLKVTTTGLTLQNIVVLADAGGNNSFIGASAEL